MAIVTCSNCQTRNRVGAIASGTPRCAKCKTLLPWVVDADEASFAGEVNASVPVVVDLWAEWCGPCRMASPVLADLAKEHAGHLKIVKVDVDKNPQLAQRYDARSIPLMVVHCDGVEVDRIVGALSEGGAATAAGACAHRLRARGRRDGRVVVVADGARTRRDVSPSPD